MLARLRYQSLEVCEDLRDERELLDAGNDPERTAAAGSRGEPREIEPTRHNSTATPVGGPVIGPGMTDLKKITHNYWTLVQRIRRLAVPGRDKMRRQVS